MRFTIVYASATGHTEDIAERLKVLLPGSELKDLDKMALRKSWKSLRRLFAVLQRGIRVLSRRDPVHHGMSILKIFLIYL